MAVLFDWSKTISELPGNPVPPKWLANKGKDVKIAFVDTGISLGLASLVHLDKMGRKFFTSTPGFSVTKVTGQDTVGEAFGVAGPGHGTLFASMLAGATPTASADKDLVGGIAPDAEWHWSQFGQGRSRLADFLNWWIRDDSARPNRSTNVLCRRAHHSAA